jgi:hypothetical protein
MTPISSNAPIIAKTARHATAPGDCEEVGCKNRGVIEYSPIPEKYVQHPLRGDRRARPDEPAR